MENGHMHFTATIYRGADGLYLGSCQEVRGATSFGRTEEELMSNLTKAVIAMLKRNRLKSEEEAKSKPELKDRKIKSFDLCLE